MKTRQAIKPISLLFILLEAMTACSASNPPVSISTSLPPTASSVSQANLTPSPFPTSTPLACLTQPGRVEEGVLDSTDPPQEFLIYLPPCYDEKTEKSYPVLYLLHGQTYRADQWTRLGAVEALDDLILSGESIPFIIVFPDDRYWNLAAGAGFGERLVDDLIPFIDSSYRTLPDRDQRAIGGLSRGAGWALQLGLTRWELFSMIGLHSLAVRQRDASKIPGWLAEIPPSSRPRVFMDIGDDDPELRMAQSVEEQFTEHGFSHEWRLYSGAHTEEYWRAHVEEYIRWYAEGWNQASTSPV